MAFGMYAHPLLPVIKKSCRLLYYFIDLQNLFKQRGQIKGLLMAQETGHSLWLLLYVEAAFQYVCLAGSQVVQAFLIRSWHSRRLVF